jgi:hypothetical protein
MKIDMKIECIKCGAIGAVKVKRHDSVSKKGTSWTRKKCTKCGHIFER